MLRWYERSMDTVHDELNVKGFFEQYRFLSNFELCYVFYEGIEYPSSENAYQAAKCAIAEEREKFVKLTPSESKKLGRTIELRKDWEEVKLKVMEDILIAKFTQNDYLWKKLKETGNRYLEETNWWKDKFWGVCDGVGKNNLGKILMKIRDNF